MKDNTRTMIRTISLAEAQQALRQAARFEEAGPRYRAVGLAGAQEALLRGSKALQGDPMLDALRRLVEGSAQPLVALAARVEGTAQELERQESAHAAA